MNVFQCPLKPTINYAHFVFNTDHAVVNFDTTYQLNLYLSMITRDRERTEG